MESASVPEPGAVAVERPQLKANAIGYLSNIVIGVASVAPAYSLATTLGYIAVISGLGYQSVSTIWIAFLPMAAIALAYYFLNKADPDCGTTFSWMTKAMGPYAGFQGGWAIVVADVLVMPNLAQIASQYTYSFFGNDNPSTFHVAILGLAWIAVMTLICYIGIELNAATQRVLLFFEFFVLVVFSVVALIKVYSGHPVGSVHPDISWFNPFAIKGGISALNGGLLLAIFLYWGWDSGVSINEETENSAEAPGKAALVSNVVLIGIFVLVTTAVSSFGGLNFLIHNQSDVFTPLGKSVLGSVGAKFLTLAILFSASASTQTTILPTARTTLSMGRAGAFPRQFGEIHPRFLSPGFSTIWMGTVSALVYILLMATSPTNLIADAFTSLSIVIAFYYGFSGYACVVYYRKQLFDSWRKFLTVGLIPLLGGLFLTWILIKAFIEYSPADGGYAKSFLGIGSPIAIALLMIVLGIIWMVVQRATMPEFFTRKPELAPADILVDDPIAVGRHAARHHHIEGTS
jgi:amino acid transporter